MHLVYQVINNQAHYKGFMMIQSGSEYLFFEGLDDVRFITAKELEEEGLILIPQEPCWFIDYCRKNLLIAPQTRSCQVST